MLKEFLSALAILLTFVAFLPYIRSIGQGQTKPHVFTWIIWGSATIVVFAAQTADGGGVGAWPIGISALLTLYVALLAYLRRGDISITRSDWAFLIVALTALPAWVITDNPLWAVIILTGVDLSGFGPTVRKAWLRPFEEQLTFFGVGALRNLVVVLALENYTLTTVLFPAAVGVACLMFITLVLLRRRLVRQTQEM